jgi:hypothetical protein
VCQPRAVVVLVVLVVVIIVRVNYLPVVDAAIVIERSSDGAAILAETPRATVIGLTVAIDVDVVANFIDNNTIIARRVVDIISRSAMEICVVVVVHRTCCDGLQEHVWYDEDAPGHEYDVNTIVATLSGRCRHSTHGGIRQPKVEVPQFIAITVSSFIVIDVIVAASTVIFLPCHENVLHIVIDVAMRVVVGHQQASSRYPAVDVVVIA